MNPAQALLYASISASALAAAGPPPVPTDPDISFVAVMNDLRTPYDAANPSREIGIRGNFSSIPDAAFADNFGFRSVASGAAILDRDAGTTLGSDQFTIEGFAVIADANTTNFLISDYYGANNRRGWDIRLTPTTAGAGGLWFRSSTDGTSGTIQEARFNFAADGVTTTTVRSGAVIHWAATRDSSGTVRVFVNGLLGGTTYSLGSNAIFTPTNHDFIPIGATHLTGGTVTSAMPEDSRLGEIRITKGVCRYTAAFTAPTVFPRGVDDPHWASVTFLFSRGPVGGFGPDFRVGGGSAPCAVTNASGSTNLLGPDGLIGGSSGGRVAHLNASWADLGSDDFTLEAFNVIFNTTSGTRHIAGTGADFDTDRAYRLHGSGSDLIFSVSLDGTAASLTLTATGFYSAGVPFDIAVTREGTSFRLYVDGVLRDSGTLSGAIHHTATSAFSVGRFTRQSTLGTGGSLGNNCFLGGYRLTKGVARYTGSSYTVPTLPLPRV